MSSIVFLVHDLLCTRRNERLSQNDFLLPRLAVMEKVVTMYVDRRRKLEMLIISSRYSRKNWFILIEVGCFELNGGSYEKSKS